MKYIICFIFLLVVFIFTFNLEIDSQYKYFIIISALVAAYMSMNIGANDVANSVGPAVGSNTISLKWAVVIAAIGNISGAVIAGGDVVSTIKNGIIDISGFSGNTYMFMIAMLSALIGSAIWLNLATYIKAPVSTTHAIVGGIMGSGIAAVGFNMVSWGTMGKIAASWVISPLIGGIVAAIILYMIKTTIVFKKDKVSSAKIWVPFFVAIMAWSFSAYLIIKGLKHVIKLDFLIVSIISLIIAIIVYFGVKIYLKNEKLKIFNTRESINILFTIPLIFAVGLLTFAHGANDVANAIGPLAGIYDSVISGNISGEASIPLRILIVGGVGISVGLLTFGPRMIKRVGSEITELDRIRAFSIALSAALTVIIASQLGLPVSSTHIALGGIFGVGFLREYLDKKNNKKKVIYVKRKLILSIIGAWLITVPFVAFLSGIIYLIIIRI